MKKVEVVAGIIEYDGKILCMQRDAGKFDYISYKWEFPGGKIEEGETYEQALARELSEEMEMTVDIKKHYTDISYPYPDFELTMHCFLCDAHSKDFVMNVHKDFRWLNKSELKQLDWAPADFPVVEKLLND